MDEHKFYSRKNTGLLAIGILLAIILFIALFKSSPKLPDSDASSTQTAIEAARKESYDLGYTNGYNAAKEENEAAYKRGYGTARKEIGSRAFTRNGILGCIVGLMLGIGGVVFIKRKELSERFEEFKKRIELRRAFRTIPANLSPEIDAIAHQIARAYINVLVQFRMNKGYIITQYAKQWTPKLDELMKKTLRLMELIKELETAHANINELQLATTIKALQRTAKSAKSDDATRNAAVKSLQRAKQTQKDLLKNRKNLENCKTSLQGITGVLESMHLKISNLKVNTQKTELLDELSSDLEAEMSMLEEALSELTL